MMPNGIECTGKRQAGFTLIELMVSALVLGVTISGVMAMIGAGRDLELGKELRRQAGIIAHSALEDTLYHHSRYSVIASPSLVSLPVMLNTTVADIPSTLDVEVSDGSVELTRYSGGTVTVPFKTILARVSWVGTQADNFSVRKRIVQARP